MSYKIEHFVDSRGKKPVLDFIDTLPPKHKSKVLAYIGKLREQGVEFKEPYTRHIEGKLRELRVEYEKNNYRIIHFFYVGKRIILLNAFLKKTPKTPKNEIEISNNRLELFLKREVH